MVASQPYSLGCAGLQYEHAQRSEAVEGPNDVFVFWPDDYALVSNNRALT